MKNGLQYITILCLLSLLYSCASFYNRHYTKGIFHENFARKDHKPSKEKENAFAPEASPVLAYSSSDSSACRHRSPVPSEKRMPLHHEIRPERFVTPEQSLPQSVLNRHITTGSIFKKKSLQSVRKQFRASQHGDSVVVTALLYILALVLALGIIALAIYFLPSIVIPAAISSTFMSAILIGAVILLVLFVALIYTIIRKLIDLFRPRKENDDF